MSDKCTYPGCNRRRMEGGGGLPFFASHYTCCEEHVCAYSSECGRTREVGSWYCSAHVCKVPGCTNGRKRQRGNTIYLYCEEHTCEEEGCAERRQEGSRFCSRHKHSHPKHDEIMKREAEDARREAEAEAKWKAEEEERERLGCFIVIACVLLVVLLLIVAMSAG